MKYVFSLLCVMLFQIATPANADTTSTENRSDGGITTIHTSTIRGS